MNGTTLRSIFDRFCPFGDGGELKPEGERVTILAANANIPIELEGRGFMMAAAEAGGSPLIIQLSYNALRALANGRIEAGAAMAAQVLAHYADIYGAPLVALSLDHFRVPRFGGGRVPAGGDSMGRRVYGARIEHALEFMEQAFGKATVPSGELLDEYLAYLCSEEYLQFKRDFLRAVETMRPAWAMIDTEHLPPLLDFVVTRDVIDSVRGKGANKEVLIEAEYGATGSSGRPIPYERLRGEDLELFAEQVACFVDYTGADGISYPIGMVHAAPADEKHEPDVERLYTVGRRLLERTGRYVPFAQHGGTGAAVLARGLVGKNNVNTFFLVAMANALADHVLANAGAIRAGNKNACGPDMYSRAMEAVKEAAVAKLKEAGSYGVAPELLAQA